MPRRHAFTLLELAVVIFLLATLSLSAISLVGRTDHQIRYEDTRSRLLRLRDAIVGEGALAGYVADMGVLPADVASLLDAPGNAEAFGLKAPSLGGVDLPGLPKGWRGPYLALPPARAGAPMRFRDRWGNVSRDAAGDPDPTADASDHGWRFEVDAGTLTLASRGADGLPGDSGETAYDADIELTIPAANWRVEVAGWSVDVRNATGESRDLLVTLLVYEYDPATGSAWQRYDTDTVTVADGTTASLTFPSQAGRVVPIGRHLLVVVEDGAGDAPYENSDSTHTTRQVAFGATNPRTTTGP